MTITNHSLNFFAKDIFLQFLSDDAVTGIAINRPGELWFEKFGTWQKHESPNITNKLLKSFAVAFAGFNDGCIDDVQPILSGTLETKERVQVVFPPAVEKNTISITLRKPSDHIFPHSSYVLQGFYQNLQTKKLEQNQLIELYRNGKFPRFLERATALGKTIVFAGATGSGKTSFMKTLIEYIPLNCRLITIEDTAEVKFVKHQNYVHLFFPSEAASNNHAIVTPSQLLKACFRMKPDRILLSEIRGAETWEFLKVISSGHGGTMTSMHAGSVHEAIEGIITRCFQNPECQNLSYQIIKNMVLSNIDIICHINCHNGKRYLSDLYFKDVHDQNIKFIKSA